MTAPRSQRGSMLASIHMAEKAPVAITPAMQHELGVVDSNPAGQFADYYESTPEMRWPNSMRIYDRMRKTEPRCRAQIMAMTHPILQTSWRVIGSGVNPVVRAFVESELGLSLDANGRRRSREGGVSWDKTLRHLLLHLVFGFAPMEQTFPVGPADVDGLDGQMVGHLELAPRMPRSIVGIDLDAKGGLAGIRQAFYHSGAALTPAQRSALSPSGDIPIGRDRLVMIVNDLEGSDWAGQSVFRSSFKHFLLKDALLRLGVAAVDRQGMGVPVITYPSGQTDGSAMRRKALEIATQMRSGEDSGVALEEGWSAAILGVSGSVQSAIEWVKYHDQAMAVSNLAMFLELGHDGGLGHGAVSENFIDYFLMALTAVVRNIEEIVTEEIIKPLVRNNFGPDEPYPVLVADELSAEGTPTAKALRELAQAGLIEPDLALRQEVRRRIGLPPETPTQPGQDEGAGLGPVGNTGRGPLQIQQITAAIKNLVGGGMTLADAMKMLGLDPNSSADVRDATGTLPSLTPNGPVGGDPGVPLPGMGGPAGAAPPAVPSYSGIRPLVAYADYDNDDVTALTVGDPVTVPGHVGLARVTAIHGLLATFSAADGSTGTVPAISLQRIGSTDFSDSPQARMERFRITGNRTTERAKRAHRSQPSRFLRTAGGYPVCLLCGQTTSNAPSSPTASAPQGMCPGLANAPTDSPSAAPASASMAEGDTERQYRIPDEAQHNARNGLTLHGQGVAGGTSAGLARARQLAAGGSVDLATVITIAGWFARHDAPRHAERTATGTLTPHGLTRLLWGGDTAKRWATKIAVNSSRSSITASGVDVLAAFSEGDDEHGIDWTGLPLATPSPAAPPASSLLDRAKALVAQLENA